MFFAGVINWMHIPEGLVDQFGGKILQRPATLVPRCQYFCIWCRIITLVRLKTRFCFSAEIVSLVLCETFCAEVLWDSKNWLHSTSILFHHHHCNYLCYHHYRHHYDRDHNFHRNHQNYTFNKPFESCFASYVRFERTFHIFLPLSFDRWNVPF